jgi:serine/threonine protein kinase
MTKTEILQELLRKLGLSDNATGADIESAVEAKLKQLSEKESAAPTEELKKKFANSREQLEKMRDSLLHVEVPKAGVSAPDAPASDASVSSAKPAEQSKPAGTTSRRSSLSQTKMADLPSADPRNAFLGEDGRAELNIPEGTQLAGRYTVHEQIGAGGMGAVYRAEDANTGREIAIKVLLPALLSNDKARERFLDEARISQQLSHPQIVNVFDVQQDGDFYFLTMELLEGQDLRQIIENKQSAGQTFSLEETKEILTTVCEGLSYAHGYTVHRDIKPENIWLTETGEYKIMDFGIAQVQSTGQRTKTGAAMGTAYYMAPEQLKGVKDIDGRADQYALAVLAYELLTGEVPAGMIEPITQHRKDVPRGFAAAIHKALAPNRDNRFASINEFKEAVSNGKKGAGIDLSGLSGLPWTFIGGGAAAVALLMVVIGVSAGGDGLRGFWDSIRPYSEDEVLAFNRTAASVEGRAKTAERRLTEYRSGIENKLRDNQYSVRQLESEKGRASSSRRKSIDAELKQLDLDERNLKRQRDLLRDYVVESDFAGELSGRLGLAKSLLQERKYNKAMPEFEAVDQGYSKLLAALEPSASLAHHYNNTRENRDEWEKTRAKHKPGQIAFADQVAKRYDEGHELLAQLDIVDATSFFEVLSQDYKRLTKALSEGEKFKTAAAKSKTSWESYATKNSLKTDYTAAYAKRYEAVEGQWKAGEIVTASEGYEQLNNDYTQLEDAAKNSKAYHAKASSAKRVWEGYASKNKLSISLTSEYSKAFKQAESQMKSGNLVDSAKNFADLTSKYGALHGTAKSMLSQQYQTYQLSKEWDSLVSKGWATSARGKSAGANYQAANKSKGAGSWTKAVESYKTSQAEYRNIIKTAKDRRATYDSQLSAWSSKLSSAKSDVSKYRSRLSSLDDDLRDYRGDMDQNCSSGSGWGAVASGLDSASCEMGCNRQVYNGYYYETKTDQYCLNGCRNKARNAERARERKIEQCEEKEQRARRNYSDTEDEIEDVRDDLSSAQSRTNSLERQRPGFSPY